MILVQRPAWGSSLHASGLEGFHLVALVTAGDYTLLFTKVGGSQKQAQ